MFQSRLGALAFVGITLIGVASLVGTEENDGTLAESIAQIEQQRDDFVDQTQAVAQPVAAPAPAQSAEEELVTEFASEEDLIVDPTGFDPTPQLEDPAAGEVVLVESETTETAQ